MVPVLIGQFPCGSPEREHLVLLIPTRLVIRRRLRGVAPMIQNVIVLEPLDARRHLVAKVLKCLVA